MSDDELITLAVGDLSRLKYVYKNTISGCVAYFEHATGYIVDDMDYVLAEINMAMNEIFSQ
jgi:hypothetical protein